MSPRAHLINPSELSFGVAVITLRWLYVLAAATGTRWGDPFIVDKDFNLSGDALVARLRTFRQHGVHVLGSFIFGLPSD